MFKNLVLAFVVIISLNAHAKEVHSVVSDNSTFSSKATDRQITDDQRGELLGLPFVAELSHLRLNVTPQVTNNGWRFALDRFVPTEGQGFIIKQGDSSKHETAGRWWFRFVIMLVIVYLFKSGPLMMKLHD